MIALWLAIPLLLAQVTDPLLGWMNRIAQSQLDARELTIAAIRDRAAADRRRDLVRQKILQSIGGLPDYSGPLNVRTTGRIQADGYVIEKVLFDSLRDLRISANVYRPLADGRYPAVLVPAGHTQEGKPESQILAANLARKGFVAMTYDPIGQGEREQTYLPILGRALSGGGGNEHLELGARSLLLGQSVARYFIQDARRGLDYLASRPDVDADRLGVAGCSGGGCITTYIAALDPRVKAAAPACYIQTFRKLFPGPTADSEMSLPRFLANGLDIADLVELQAPRVPWLLMATTEDYFGPEGARPVYEEAKRFYSLYGAGDRVEFSVAEGPHGTPREAREAIYAWMIRWLKDGRGDAAESAVRQYTNLELRVTDSGQVDGRKVWEAIRDEVKPIEPADLRTELKRLGVVPQKGEVKGKFYDPGGSAKKPAVIVIEDKRLRVPLYVQPSQSTESICQALKKAGALVYEIEVRDSPDANEGRPFLGNWVTNERADLIGHNLPAMRAADIMRAVDVLASRPDVSSIRGYARGVKGFWMLMAAAADPRIKGVWLDRMPVSLRSAFDAPLTNNLFDVMIPGFALHWDFADLITLLQGRQVLRTDPANWMNQIVAAGPEYRYRYVGQGDADYAAEFLR